MDRLAPSTWLVLALLLAAALLISVPALRAPDAGDVCNGPSGTTASLAVAIVAFISAERRTARAKLSLRLLARLAWSASRRVSFSLS